MSIQEFLGDAKATRKAKADKKAAKYATNPASHKNDVLETVLITYTVIATLVLVGLSVLVSLWYVLIFGLPALGVALFLAKYIEWHYEKYVIPEYNAVYHAARALSNGE